MPRSKREPIKLRRELLKRRRRYPSVSLILRAPRKCAKSLRSVQKTLAELNVQAVVVGVGFSSTKRTATLRMRCRGPVAGAAADAIVSLAQDRCASLKVTRLKSTLTV